MLVSVEDREKIRAQQRAELGDSIAALQAELEASKGREKLWQGRSNVMREEMQKSEAENTRLEGLLNLILDKLDQPGGMHRYWEGIHQSDCDACKLRNWLRKTLEHADA